MKRGVWIVAGLFAVVCCGGMVPGLIAEPGPHETLQDLLPGFSIARCLFAEGKLVLEHEEKFIVLREGDVLPGRSGVRVLEIKASRAVLAESPGKGLVAKSDLSLPAVPERLILIDQDPSGRVDVALLSAELPAGTDLAPERIEPGGLFVPGQGADGASGEGFVPSLGEGAEAAAEGAAEVFRDGSPGGGEP